MRKHLLSILILLGLVWFLYYQTGGFEFLRLDDHDYTFRCTFVKDGFSLANMIEAFTNPRHAAIWMPGTYVSYMLDISLFGPGMGPHHLINVVFHSLNAILFYFLLFRIFSSPTLNTQYPMPNAPKQQRDNNKVCLLALLCTAIWAIHPQRAEAVAWIAGRKELLCAFFTLLGLLSWIHPSRSARCVAYICCALACMSKPTAMCFPFLAFAVEWTLTPSRFQYPAPNSQHPTPRTKSLVPYIPFLLLSVATGLLAIYSQTHPEGRSELALFSASLSWRLLNAAVTIGLSLFQAIVPVGIHLDYRATPGQFPLDGMLGLSSLCTALCLLVVWVILRRDRDGARPSQISAPNTQYSTPNTQYPVPSPWPILLFFLAALAPTLGIFGSFGEHARADRFLYLPMMAFPLGIMALCRFTTPDTQHPIPNTRYRIPFIIGSIPVFVYLCSSFPVVTSYKNDFSVFSRTLHFDPDNGRALSHVASEECARFGHIDKGITLYRRSQELRPRDDTAAQLAYTLTLRGLSSDYAEIRRLCAKFACDHSLDRKGMALEALGTTAMRQRKWAEAISCLEDSVKAPLRFYSAEDALLRLGACYCNAKRPGDAIRIFEPLTQSSRTDVASRARQFLGMVKKNPQTLLFF